MANTQIESSSIVRLRSGGPDMTVSEIKIHPDCIIVWCDWFDGRKHMHAAFRFHTLELATPQAAA